MSGSELVERVENAEVGSRELDGEIAGELKTHPVWATHRPYRGIGGHWWTNDEESHMWGAPPYSTDQRAAHVLAARMGVSVSPESDPLQICAAILRAHEAGQ